MPTEGTVGEAGSIRRRLTLRFDHFVCEALSERRKRHEASPARFVQLAAAYHVAELSSDRSTNRYPRFARSARGRSLDLTLDLTNREWMRLSREARRQEISLEQLLEHATIRLLADLDAGRVTERLLRRMGRVGPSPPADR